ncbi:MAG: polysaccharide deacetylase family protein [Bdellovibrionales bacterium]|nr:polysaccharide deacetylase family protein [Bdellovibrionales bacterium]
MKIVCAIPEKFGEDFLKKITPYQNRGQVFIQRHQGFLNEVIHSGGLILGAGRVALEALLMQAPVFAMGEHSAPGLVELENIEQNLCSNFGDIGRLKNPENLNLDKIREQFQRFICSDYHVSPEIISIIKKEYDGIKINQSILETYRAALCKRAFPKGIPILMYHKIPEKKLNSRHRIFVEKSKFHWQLKGLRLLGFKSTNFSQLKQAWFLEKSYKELPKKPILITFDDGYQDTLTNALPLLEQFGFQATLFLLADQKIANNQWDLQNDPHETPSPLLNAAERKKISSHSLIEIASHGLDHKHLGLLNKESILHQLEQSKKDLEKELNVSINCFAFPYGDRPTEASTLAAQSYEFAVNTDEGGFHFADDRHSLFRVNIFPEDGFFALWKKTSPWYRQRFFRKHGR